MDQNGEGMGRNGKECEGAGEGMWTKAGVAGHRYVRARLTRKRAGGGHADVTATLGLWLEGCAEREGSVRWWGLRLGVDAAGAGAPGRVNPRCHAAKPSVTSTDYNE